MHSWKNAAYLSYKSFPTFFSTNWEEAHLCQIHQGTIDIHKNIYSLWIDIYKHIYTKEV